MSDHRNDRVSANSPTDRGTDVQLMAVTSNYKVLGELTQASGVGVLGQNNAGSGSPIGIMGVVPETSGGYGLATPDDVRIEGRIDTAETDFVVEAGTTATSGATNVVLGHASNRATSGVSAGTIGGGGLDDGSNDYSNIVSANFGTVCGGARNEAKFGAFVGGGYDNTASGDYATVAGGYGNRAAGNETAIGGGFNNEATGALATIAGGIGNSLSGEYGTVGGGSGNLVDTQKATVSGGVGNEAKAESATIGGGDNNTADAKGGTVSGGIINDATGVSATVGGGFKNKANGDYATVAGGGPSDPNDAAATKNVVHDNYGTIAGGGNNQAGQAATSGTAHAVYATVSGGQSNTASADQATVGGGFGNDATNAYATVCGGTINTASGKYATVLGGASNRADQDYAVAAGNRAKARNAGTFVWADSQSADFASDTDYNGSGVTGADTFHVRAKDGVRIVNSAGTTYVPPTGTGWSTASSRTMKANVNPVDPRETLADLESLEIATWEYAGEDGTGQGTRHIGPMAEDFADAFEVGDSDRHINSVNADGVALAAIQGLSEKLDEAREAIDEKDERIDTLDAENARLRDHLQRVEDRLAAIENRCLPDSQAAD